MRVILVGAMVAVVAVAGPAFGSMDVADAPPAQAGGAVHFTNPSGSVIVEPNEAKAVLNWAVREMEERYKVLAATGVRNIAAYNSRPEANGPDAAEEQMPYIVLIIDELADLIMREGRFVAELAGPHISPEAIVAAAVHVPEQVQVEVPA